MTAGTGVIMIRNDSVEPTLDAGIALKTGRNGEGSTVEIDHKHVVQRMKADNIQEHQPSDSEPDRPAKPGRRPWVWALLGVAAVVGIGVGVAYYLYSLSYESTDDAFIDGHVVAVSPRVAGHVAKVYVTDNQWVNQGELLAELDPRDFEARLAAAEAAIVGGPGGPEVALHRGRRHGNHLDGRSGRGFRRRGGRRAAVETARAAVATAKSQQAQAQAQLAAVQAGRKQAQADLVAAEARQQRADAFLKRIAGAGSRTCRFAGHPGRSGGRGTGRRRRRFGGAATDHGPRGGRPAGRGRGRRPPRAAFARPSRAWPGNRPPWDGPRPSARPRNPLPSRWRRADRKPTRPRPRWPAPKPRSSRPSLNLSYTKIYAPISGHVTRKSVEIGTYVQIGQPLLALVDPDVWVIANFKETQLAKMQPGQPVTVTVDTHPGVKFAAHVDSLQRGSGARFSLLPPENATGNYVKVVQRVPVKIVFDDLKQVEQYGLGPGMSVVPTVKVD